MREARERVGLSQLDLAERVGVSMQTISNVERGEGVSVPVIAALARELGVSPSSLFGPAPTVASPLAPLMSMLSPEDLLIVTALVRTWVEHRRRSAHAAERLANPREKAATKRRRRVVKSR